MIYAAQERVAVSLGFLLFDHHSVLRGDLKVKGLDKLVLIQPDTTTYGNQIPPSLLEISSYGINLSFTALPIVVDISDVRAEEVPGEVTASYNYVVSTSYLGGIKVGDTFPPSRRSLTACSDSPGSRLVDTSDVSLPVAKLLSLAPVLSLSLEVASRPSP